MVDCQPSTGAVYAPETDAAIEAAIRAGGLLLDASGSPPRGSRKGSHDVVTSLDRAAERLIMSHLRRAFPRDGRLGEETGLGGPAGARRVWLVDPLDGTINYAEGLDPWCVSIALAIGGRPVVGVIADPARGILYQAVAGRGAWRSPIAAWRPGHPGASAEETGPETPSAVRLRLRRLARAGDAVVAADPGEADDPAAAARIEAIRSRTRAVRAFGSTASSLALLAAGRLDGVCQVRGLQAVDIAAGALLAAEAGARVTDARGRQLRLGADWRDHGIAAAGATVHRILVAGVSPAPAP